MPNLSRPWQIYELESMNRRNQELYPERRPKSAEKVRNRSKTSHRFVGLARDPRRIISGDPGAAFRIRSIAAHRRQRASSKQKDDKSDHAKAVQKPAQRQPLVIVAVGVVHPTLIRIHRLISPPAPTPSSYGTTQLPSSRAEEERSVSRRLLQNSCTSTINNF